MWRMGKIRKESEIERTAWMENMGKAAEAPVTSKSSIFFSVIAPPLALRRNTEPEYTYL